LIELLVVIFILALLAGVVVPRFTGDVIERANLRAATGRIAAAATFAHNQAASRAVMHELHLDFENGAYWVESEKPVETGEEESRHVAVRGKLPSGVTIRDIRMEREIPWDEAVAKVRFSPEGWADTAAIYIVDSQARVHTVLVLGQLGRVETYDSEVEID
jgi:Tfp pilus assembly protein FimT